MTFASRLDNLASRINVSAFELCAHPANTITEKTSRISQIALKILQTCFFDAFIFAREVYVKFCNKIFSTNYDRLQIPSITKIAFRYFGNHSESFRSALQKHLQLKSLLQTRLREPHQAPIPFTWNESEFASVFSAPFLHVQLPQMNGPEPMQKLWQLGESFTHFQELYDLRISRQTMTDFLRTPVRLTTKNQRTHNFGTLNPRQELDPQIREFKTRCLQSLGNTPRAHQMVELIVNCIHQEQIKPPVYYANHLLKPGENLISNRSGRLFSIQLDESGSCRIHETISMRVHRTNLTEHDLNSDGEVRALDTNIDLSQSFTITPDLVITGTSYTVAVSSALAPS